MFFKLFGDTKAQNMRQLLVDNFIVYRKSDKNGRRKFEKRICHFIQIKKFRAADPLVEISDEMRMMIAAAAIQITFGYPNVYFSHFKTIIVYAEEYYSNLTGLYHQGEVNAGGAIVLSWKNFMSSFGDTTDGRNLALHEMAHALQLTNITDATEYGFLDRAAIAQFEAYANIEIQIIKSGESTFFRAYGAANLQEFFSVAVECFFEKPEEFRNYDTELYILLSRILKMDLLQPDFQVPAV